jgi:hypothetical protein
MRKDLFRGLLLKAHHTEEPVAVYSSTRRVENFAVGFVKGIREYDVSLALITPEGDPDGVSVCQMDDIVMVEVGSRYLSRLRFLYENRDQTMPPPVGFAEDATGSSCVATELQTAHDNREIVSLWIGEGTDTDVHLSGYVADLHDGFTKIAMLTPEGDEDGLAVMRIEDIDRLNRASRDEQILDLLNRTKHGTTE